MKKILNYTYYIDKEGEHCVKQFKYNGGSDSFLYIHLWSPLSQFLVDRVFPTTLAPNMITLFGFMLLFLGHCLSIYYSPDLQSHIPSWVFYYNCIGTLFYQVLDNADGKQARATQSSSPLGMLFDHGCDTLGSWMLGYNALNALQLQNINHVYYTLILVGVVPFFIGMWSQYFKGQMRLAYINGVDEGLVILEAIFLLTGLYGQEFWQTESFFGFALNQLVVGVILLLGILQMIQFIAETLLDGKKECSDKLKSLLCILFLCTTFVCFKELKAEKEDDLEKGKYFILYIYPICLIWSKMILYIQLAHITEEKFNQWRPSFFVILSSYLVNSIYGYYTGYYLIRVELLVIGMLLFACYSYLHMVLSICLHMSEILGIQVFSIKKLKQ